MKKPNIVFLLADDQRYNTISALGNKEIFTPNLDKMVNNGFSFENAHISGGTSGAVCMPSRAMLNTGRTLFHIDGCGEKIPEEHTTIGELLQQNGYNSHGIGKWHNGTESYARSFNSGANIFFGGMWDHWNVPVCDYDTSGNYDNWIKYTPDFFYSNSTISACADRIATGKHSTDLMAEAAIDYVNNYSDEKPFYMYVSFLAPHDPRTMPEKFRNMYDPEKITLPENFAPEHIFDYGIKDVRDEVLANYPRNKKEIKKHIAEYYAMISHLDDAIGRIVDSLKQKGELENTIIIYTGDNGLAIGSHGLMGKQNIYDHSVRVPLIFSAYNRNVPIPINKKSDKYVYLFDIFSTICELCNVDIPKSVEGKSLIPVFESNATIRDDLYLAYCDSVRGVKNNQYKFIEYRTNTSHKIQLFDLLADPLETNDLSDDKKYQNILVELRDRMLQYNYEWNDSEHVIGKLFWNK